MDVPRVKPLQPSKHKPAHLPYCHRLSTTGFYVNLLNKSYQIVKNIINISWDRVLGVMIPIKCEKLWNNTCYGPVL